jgi:chromosome segregation ATPase
MEYEASNASKARDRASA